MATHRQMRIWWEIGKGIGLAALYVGLAILFVCHAEAASDVPAYVVDSSWEQEEVVVELDEDNKDENGYEYKIDSDMYAQLTDLGTCKNPDDGYNVEIRVPDKAVKDGKEYIVNAASLQITGERGEGVRLRVYIGKDTRVNHDCASPSCSAIYVHSENPYCHSENGTLYSKTEEETLLHFNDEHYGSDDSYVIPEGIERIGHEAFYDADVKEVLLSESVKRIESRAFLMSSIQRIDLKNVTGIGSDAFQWCRSLKEVRINREGTVIERGAFDGSGIENIFLPAGTVCSVDAFKYCRKLKTAVFGDGSSFENTDYEVLSFFDSAINLRTVILPGDISRIPDYIFADCTSLQKLYIPETVTKVGSGCFDGMSGTVYGQEGSATEEAVNQAGNEELRFVSLKDHTHQLSRVTFFAYDSWAVIGDYCDECAYGTEIERVWLSEPEDREKLPPMYEPDLPPQPTLQPTPTVAPASEPPEVIIGENRIQPSFKPQENQMVVEGFKVDTRDNKNVRLRWKKNSGASIFIICRAVKRNGKYRAIATVKGSKTCFYDKQAKPMRKYYYKVQALGKAGGRADSGVRTIRLTGICNPRISVKKGQVSEIKYILLTLKKYGGKYIDIYVSLDGKRFKKLKLLSDRISVLGRSFKIKYVVKNDTMGVRVRTWTKRGKKKYYSKYSNVVHVTL